MKVSPKLNRRLSNSFSLNFTILNLKSVKRLKCVTTLTVTDYPNTLVLWIFLFFFRVSLQTCISCLLVMLAA